MKYNIKTEENYYIYLFPYLSEISPGENKGRVTLYPITAEYSFSSLHGILSRIEHMLSHKTKIIISFKGLK